MAAAEAAAAARAEDLAVGAAKVVGGAREEAREARAVRAVAETVEGAVGAAAEAAAAVETKKLVRTTATVAAMAAASAEGAEEMAATEAAATSRRARETAVKEEAVMAELMRSWHHRSCRQLLTQACGLRPMSPPQSWHPLDADAVWRKPLVHDLE